MNLFSFLSRKDGIQSTVQNLRSYREWGRSLSCVLLANISDPSLVTLSIAKVLGINEVPSKKIIDSLTDFLNNKELLIFLDNFEHLLPSAHIINKLVNSSTSLKVLITNRTILNVKNELQQHLLISTKITLQDCYQVQLQK